MLSFKEFIDEDKLPARMKLHDAEKLLKKAGYTLNRITKHRIWTHPDPSKEQFALPSHPNREFSPGITRKLFALSEELNEL